MKNKKVLILVFSLYTLQSGYAQKLQWKSLTKSLIAPTSLSFISGASWGIHEKTMHQWGIFQAKFPNANPQFWNPSESWRNKYVGGNPDLGRKKIAGLNVPVQFTDAKHLLASTNQIFGFAAGCTIFIGERKPWWHYAVKVGASFVGYSIGNAITYDWIY